jgi:two-component system phosphate regulon sensor histidine kinase PhoR
MFRDRGQIKELKEALEEAARKIGELEKQCGYTQTVLESMVEGVISVDRETRIISVNSSVEKIFGLVKKDVQGRFFLEVIRNNDIAEIIDKVLKNGEFISAETSLFWPIQRIFQVNASSIFEKGRISGCLLVIHDITQMRKLEIMRRDFVANVSHELKTPLTSIKGFVETLLEGALEDKENNWRFLKIIQEHADRLDNLVNDLLSLSHFESKEIVLKKSPLELRQEATNVISGFKSQLKKKDIEVKNELSADIAIIADKNRLGQVITNLFDNAIKFNKEKGFVRIYGEETNGKVKITVEDSGIGIPEKDIPRIFERFYRVDKARSRELGGTGLGLSIVKHIIELHGGTVGVESTEGLGSKFWFIIPKKSPV